MRDIDSLIIDRSLWLPLSNIPSYNVDGNKFKSFWENFPTNSGVYLVAHRSDLRRIKDNEIHERIGYIGKSKNLARRVSSIRKKGEHGVGIYANQMKWETEDLYIKMLFTSENDETELEKTIQACMVEKHKRPYFWEGASDGVAGNVTKILNMFSNLTPEEKKDIMKMMVDEL